MAKITLVDDDENIVASVSLALESHGHVVKAYFDGASGLAALESAEQQAQAQAEGSAVSTPGTAPAEASARAPAARPAKEELRGRGEGEGGTHARALEEPQMSKGQRKHREKGKRVKQNSTEEEDTKKLAARPPEQPPDAPDIPGETQEHACDQKPVP